MEIGGRKMYNIKYIQSYRRMVVDSPNTQAYNPI